MEWMGLVVRTIGMYLVVFIVLRMMGKREIGKLSVLDLIISIMIAEIAVIEIESVDKNFTHGLVPIITLLIIQIATAFLSMKSRKIRILLDGKPSIIIANGKINKEQLKKIRYSLDDLLLQLRENGYTSISQIEFAILETSGKLSVFAKEDDNNGQSKDQSSSDETSDDEPSNDMVDASNTSLIPSGFRYETLPIPLILDGVVQDKNLEAMNQTRFWLKNIIQQYGAKHFRDVLLCTIDHKERIYVDVSSKNNNTT